MLSRIGNRKKNILSMLFTVLLIWGVQGVSYGQELSVSVSLLGPSTVQSGTNFNLTATVTNTGTASSAETTLSVSRSTGPSFGTGTVEPGKRAIQVLSIAGNGDWRQIPIQLTAPSTAAIYRYSVVLVRAGSDKVDNNTASVDINVQSSANARLTISPTLTVNPLSAVTPGGYITLTASVSNTGGAASSTFNVYRSSTSALPSTNPGTHVRSFTRNISNGTQAVSSQQIAVPFYVGTYYYRVQIGTDTTKTSDYAAVTVTNIVDLSVDTPSVDKSTVAPGETFTLSTAVTNIGTGSFTRSTTLRYFRSTDTTLNRTDGSDTEVGTDPIGGLGSYLGYNDTTSESITLTAPSEPGTYYYFAYVDPVHGEQYYNYNYNYTYYYNYRDTLTNNTSSYVTITVSAPPDLTVSLLRLRQTTFAPGERFTLDATVYNGGTGASASTQLRVYEDSDDRYRREQQITRQSVSAISANGSSSVSIPLTAPTDGGTYYYRVHVDTVTGETKTDNNYSNWIGIDVLEPLVLESLQPSKVTLTSGESFTLTATVKNDGSARSAGTTVRYYRSSDNRLSSSDTHLGSSTVSGIAAGGTMQVSTSLKAPQAPGTYYYGACVGDSQTYSGDACVVIKLNVLVVSVILPESQRPPMYWVDADRGTLQSLTGSDVDPFVASVRDATAIAIDMEGGKVYWAEQIDKKRSRVRRANLDGRNVQVVKEMGGAVRGIAVDSAKGNLYMTNARANGRGNIQRSKLDGSVFHWNYIDNLSPALSSPRDIALDVAGGKVYWTEDITDAATGKETIRIRRANISGNQNVEMVREISGVPRGIAVDSAKGNLYLANTRGVRGNIQRLKIDGSRFHWNYIHIDKADSPQGVALDIAAGKVYWTEAGGIRRADLNGKNRQDVATGIGSPGGIALRVAPVSTKVAAAPAAAAIVPNATALHANYPNPFNPETWIPYQLQKAADVQISIYDQRGVLVRQLSLGHQVAGQYVSRSRAAYWDGRNHLGEPVASGLYFYTLTAGDFSATRKMLIVK